MAELYTEEELRKFTVIKLKEFLRANKLKVSGLKAELIQRLLANQLGKDGLIHLDSPIYTPMTPAKKILEPFEIEKLPPEMILQICQEMDDKTLGRAVSSSKLIRDVCGDLLPKRLRTLTKGTFAVFNDQTVGIPNPIFVRRLVGQCITDIRAMKHEELMKIGLEPSEGFTNLTIELSDGSLIFYSDLDEGVGILIS